VRLVFFIINYLVKQPLHQYSRCFVMQQMWQNEFTQIYLNPLYYHNNNPHRQTREKLRERMKERGNNKGKMRSTLVVNPDRPLWASNEPVLLLSWLTITTPSRTPWWSFTTPTKSGRDRWATSVIWCVSFKRKELCFVTDMKRKEEAKWDFWKRTDKSEFRSSPFAFISKRHVV